MNTSSLPPTINLHSLIPCNYRCGFCYAGFASAGRSQIPQVELHEILRQIATVQALPNGSKRKVTFAGGEPLLSPTLIEDLTLAKKLGLVTSLVTNGALLDRDLIASLAPITAKLAEQEQQTKHYSVVDYSSHLIQQIGAYRAEVSNALATLRMALGSQA